MFWFFGLDACGILAARPGTKPAPHTLEGDVLTTRPPERFPYVFFVFLFQSEHTFPETPLHTTP